MKTQDELEQLGLDTLTLAQFTVLKGTTESAAHTC